jgi:hypothetical protein
MYYCTNVYAHDDTFGIGIMRMLWFVDSPEETSEACKEMEPSAFVKQTHAHLGSSTCVYDPPSD